MKKSSMIIFLFLSLFVSCKEEEKKGVCTACCDANKKKVCKGNFTYEMCADYNKRKVDGYDWTFGEGLTICPPTGPN